MPKFYKIPLSSTPQVFSVQLSGVDYRIRMYYCENGDSNWLFDIMDNQDFPIVYGVPLITGVNLVEQYRHLGFLGRLWVQTNSDPDAVPTFDNIGTDGFVYWVTG